MKYRSKKEKIWTPKEGKPGVRKKKGETLPKKQKVYAPKVKPNPFNYYGYGYKPQLTYVLEEHKFVVGDKVFCIKAEVNNTWTFNTLSRNKIYTIVALTHRGGKSFISVSGNPDNYTFGFYYSHTHSQDLFKKYENV